MKNFILLILLFGISINSYAEKAKPTSISTFLDLKGTDALKGDSDKKFQIDDKYAVKILFTASPAILNNNYTFSSDNISSKNSALTLSLSAEFQNIFVRAEPGFSVGKLGTSDNLQYFSNAESVSNYYVGITTGVFYDKLYFGLGFLPYDRLKINHFTVNYTSPTVLTSTPITQNVNFYGSAWNISLGYKFSAFTTLRVLYEQHEYKSSRAHFEDWSSDKVYNPTVLERTTIGFYLDIVLKKFYL